MPYEEREGEKHLHKKSKKNSKSNKEDDDKTVKEERIR